MEPIERGEMIEKLILRDLNNPDLLIDILQYGCKGYANMSDDEILQEYDNLPE